MKLSIMTTFRINGIIAVWKERKISPQDRKKQVLQHLLFSCLHFLIFHDPEDTQDQKRDCKTRPKPEKKKRKENFLHKDHLLSRRSPL